MNVATLESALDPILRGRVAAWRDPQVCPPPALLAELLDANCQGEPWFPALVTCVLEADSRQWPVMTPRLSLLRAGWRQVWEAQGCPAALAELDLSGDWPTPSQRCMAVTVGWAVERALAGGRAPSSLEAAAHVLLPGRYRPSLGWRNLRGLPREVVALLAERSGSVGNVVPEEHRSLAQLLFHYRDQPWAAHLACAAAALMGERVPDRGERNQPMTIVSVVTHTAAVLRRVFEARGLRDMGELRVTGTLHAYVRGDYDGPCESVRCNYVVHYLLSARAQDRLLAGSPKLAARLKQYRLPLPEVPMDEGALLARARATQQARRARQVAALMPLYLRLAWVLAARAAVFRGLHAAATRAREQFHAGDGAPVPFQVLLMDGSATLTFRVVSVAQLDWEARGNAATRRARPALAGQVLTEFLGARDGQEQPLPEPFFVRMHRAWYDPAVRENLVAVGHVRSDYTHHRAGLLRAPGRLGQFCGQYLRGALAVGRAPRVLLDMDALCAGVAYGALMLALSLITGMRMHELQQIRLFDGYSVFPPDGTIVCTVYPKARKRDRADPLEHVLPPSIRPYWQEVICIHDQLWPIWTRGYPENGVEMGLERGVYLFQTAGTTLLHNDLSWLARSTAFGFDLHSRDNKPVNMTTHLLRHGYARQRAGLGHPLAEIQAALGHQSPSMTRVYTGDAVGEPHRVSPQVSGTVWSALLPLPQEGQ